MLLTRYVTAQSSSIQNPVAPSSMVLVMTVTLDLMKATIPVMTAFRVWLFGRFYPWRKTRHPQTLHHYKPLHPRPLQARSADSSGHKYLKSPTLNQENYCYVSPPGRGCMRSRLAAGDDYGIRPVEVGSWDLSVLNPKP